MLFELTYSAKAPAEQILKKTPRASFHKVKSFGESLWQNQIIFGDNLSALRTLIDEKERGRVKNDDGSIGVRLIYIDPPFGTGDAYGRNQVKAYSAKRTGVDYLEWLRHRIILLRELLSDDGSFYMRTDYHFGHHMRVLLDEIFGPKGFRNE
ncbi:MAG: DNA methyltransferase, partial [Fidelibacterota bacterium]